MMSTMKLQYLMFKRPAEEMDKKEIARRVTDVSPFNSIDEAISYIRDVIDNKPINSNNPETICYKDYPYLMINIIDEGVCSIIREVYFQKDRGNADFLSYINHKVLELYNYLFNLVTKQYKQESYQVALLQLLQDISDLSVPFTKEKEEHNFGTLARSYYRLMYYMYITLPKPDSYVLKNINYYKSKIEHTLISTMRKEVE